MALAVTASQVCPPTLGPWAAREQLLTSGHVRFLRPVGTGLRTLPLGTPPQAALALMQEAPASPVLGLHGRVSHSPGRSPPRSDRADPAGW